MSSEYVWVQISSDCSSILPNWAKTSEPDEARFRNIKKIKTRLHDGRLVLSPGLIL